MEGKYETHELDRLAGALDGYVPGEDAYVAMVDRREDGTVYVYEESDGEGFKGGTLQGLGPFRVVGELPEPEGEQNPPVDDPGT
jgi:hypothetical protein